MTCERQRNTGESQIEREKRKRFEFIQQEVGYNDPTKFKVSAEAKMDQLEI